jgi:hypothetical protein
MVRVVDIQVGASAEEAERLLNEPYSDGFYLMQVYPVEGAAHRAFFKHRVLKQNIPVRNRDGKEAEALAIIKANAHLPQRRIVELLDRAGIRRGLSWVNRKMIEMMRLT